MAGMSPSAAPGGGAPPPSGGAPGAPGAGGGEKEELASKFFQLAQKWAKTGKEEETYAAKVMEILKDYFSTVLKKTPEGAASGATPGTGAPEASGAGAPPPPMPAGGPPTGGMPA